MTKSLFILGLAVAVAGIAFLVLRDPHPENRIPKGADLALQNAPELVLYSLDPRDFDRGESRFHGYRILGQTVLSSAESRKVAAESLREGLREWGGRFPTCSPSWRHGIRAKDDTGEHDFQICFECGYLRVYSPDGESGLLHMASGKGKQLTEILKAANVPLPTE